MVDEVAGEDGRQVQILTVGGGEGVDMAGDRLGQLADRRVVALDEERYLCEVDQPILREGLHGIEHAIATRMSLEQADGHRACGMDEELVFPTLGGTVDDLGECRVLDTDDEHIGLHGQCFERAAVDARHIVSRLLQCRHQVGGQPPPSYQYNLHISCSLLLAPCSLLLAPCSLPLNTYSDAPVPTSAYPRSAACARRPYDRWRGCRGTTGSRECRARPG